MHPTQFGGDTANSSTDTEHTAQHHSMHGINEVHKTQKYPMALFLTRHLAEGDLQHDQQHLECD